MADLPMPWRQRANPRWRMWEGFKSVVREFDKKKLVSSRHRLLAGFALAWIVLAGCLAVFLTLKYQGLVRKWAEWQFQAWDRYFPVATVFLIVLVLLLPVGGVVIALRIRRSRMADDSRSNILTGQIGWLLELSCFILVVFCICVLAVQLGRLASMPVGAAPFREIAVQDVDPAFSYQGPAVLIGGTIRMDIVAQHEEGIALVKLRHRYAPVMVGGRTRLFVQVVPAIENDPETAIRRGILVKTAMPHEIVELYRSIGVQVADETFVLYSNARSMQAKALLVCVASGLFGIFFAIFGYRARHRRKHPA